MTFKLTADITFEAKNLDDAFMKISDHFKKLTVENYDAKEDLDFRGDLQLTKKQ